MKPKVIFGKQTTKVKQLADIIAQEIMQGKYMIGSSLPSINSLSGEYGVSRDTVFKAFANLRERRLIDSTPGKGYYVVNRQETVFLLLDEFSPFKNTLYNSLIKHLPANYRVDLWFHQYNEHIFNTIMHEAIGRYNHYLVMNFDHEHLSSLLSKINPSRLLLLDFGKFDKEGYSYICQDFDTALYKALMEIKEKLQRYRKMVFYLPSDSKHPKSSADALERFCKDHSMEFQVVVEEMKEVEKEVVYLVIRQTDVVDVIKKSRELGLKCGGDFGLIAYNDTPAYQVIDEGITALSIDWEEMAMKAARFVMTGNPMKIDLPTKVHLRKSIG